MMPGTKLQKQHRKCVWMVLDLMVAEAGFWIFLFVYFCVCLKFYIIKKCFKPEFKNLNVHVLPITSLS